MANASKLNLRQTLATGSLLFHWNLIDPAKSKIITYLSHLVLKPSFT